MATKKVVDATAQEEVPYDLSKGAIYAAMGAVMVEVEAIGKDKQNVQQKFKYRGIDDAYNALHPLLAKHKIITVPRVINMVSRHSVPTRNGGNLNYTMINVEYDFICCVDGSKITVGPMLSEGMDAADKSCAKALASGHKYAIFQTWCIPTSDMPDGDAETHDVVGPASIMPMAAVLPQQQPAQLMPNVPTNSAPAQQSNNEIVIDTEASASVTADMVINMATDMYKTLPALREFWVLQQPAISVLQTKFPSQYQRVTKAFGDLKHKLENQQENK